MCNTRANRPAVRKTAIQPREVCAFFSDPTRKENSVTICFVKETGGLFLWQSLLVVNCYRLLGEFPSQ